MKNLKTKMRKQGGFTLIEMLIVVAIIAILIAISIPLVNQALERAREATDAANERSFKAELLVCYLGGYLDSSAAGVATGGTPFAPDHVYAYDAANGKLVETADAPSSGYGKSTELNVTDETPRKGMVLYGAVTEGGDVIMGWSETAPTATNGIAAGTLISPKMISATSGSGDTDTENPGT